MLPSSPVINTGIKYFWLNSRQGKNWIQFDVSNSENMRQEIEVHLESNGVAKFVGSAMVMEAINAINTVHKEGTKY